MVDQQTPSVRSDEELEREDAAPRDARERRDDAGDLDLEASRRAQSDAPDRLPPEGNIADIDADRAARSDAAAADAAAADARDRRIPDPTLKVRHAREVDPDSEALVRSDPAATGAADRSASEAGAGDPSTDLALFDEETSKDLRDRWLNIQMQFVDSPKDAVQKAESLVGEVMGRLTDGFARQRRELESGWSGSEETSTEDLRLAIRRYRSFFNRLLAL